MPAPTDHELIALATGYERAGRLAEAEAIYRDLLARYPDNAELLHTLGLLALRAGRFPDARYWFERAIAIDPQKAVYFNNLGSALQNLGEFEQALAGFEQAVRLDPSLIIIQYNIGCCRLALGDWDAAVRCFRQVLEQIPAHPESHLNLGLALLRKGETDGSIGVYRAALARLPNYALLWSNLGNALQEKGEMDAAVAAYRAALRCDPANALAANNLGNALMELGRSDESIELFRQCLARNPAMAEAHSNLILAIQLQPDSTPEAIAAECHRWWVQHGEPLRPAQSPAVVHASPAGHRACRIGYVSPDLREHPVGRHLLPVMGAHDFAQFEFVIYSDAQRPDAVTGQFRKCPVLWRDCGMWPDERLAAQIRRDGIDLLVDLSQHSAGNRLTVFARQPAPFQVSFAGYPGSTGLETIGFRITDRFLDPPDRGATGPEKLARLPDSFWSFDPLGETPPVNALPALPSGGVVFGCLSKFSKVNVQVIALWSEVLRQVRHSRLLLLCPEGEARTRVAAAFQQHGIERERLEFTGRLPRSDYFALHHRLDLILDPFPYNGHMTTCDALWMGLPVVSLAGETPVSRGGLSLLSTVGLPELVASTPEEYVRIAVELATDLPRLAGLRASLRKRLQGSPLMDSERFTRGLERAYREIWQRAD